MLAGRSTPTTRCWVKWCVAGNAADLSREGMDDPDRRAVGTLDPENLFVNVPITDELLVNVAAVPSVFTPEWRRGQRAGGHYLRYNQYSSPELGCSLGSTI